MGLLTLAMTYSAAGQGRVSDLVSQNISRNIADSITSSLTGQIVRPTLEIQNRAGKIVHIGVSPSGHALAVTMKDATVRLWDLESGLQIGSVRTPSGRPTVASPLSRGGTLIAGGSNGNVYSIQVGVPEEARLLGSHKGAVEVLAVSRNGKVAATASERGASKLWDLDSGDITQMGDVPATAIAFSHDSSTVAVGDSSGVVRRFSATTGGPVGNPVTVGGRVLTLAFSHDGSALVAGTTRSVVRIATETDVASRRVSVPSKSTLVLSSDGSQVAIANRSGEVDVFDVETGRKRARLNDIGKNATLFAFLADERRLLTSDGNGMAYIWNVKDALWACQLIGTKNGWTVIGRSGRFDGSEAGIENVSWNANGERIGLDRFSEQYFEPGLLASYLKDTPEFASAAPVVIEDGISLPPLMEIDLSESKRVVGEKFIFVVVAEDRGAGIGKIRLYHNGKLAPPATLHQQEDLNQDERHMRFAAFAVDPLPGLNTFKAISSTEIGIEGESPKLTETFDGAAPPSALHILSVGINKYQDPKLELAYSVPDAEAIAAQIGAEGLGPFDEIHTHLLLDQQATREGILELLKSFEETAPEDVVVVYFAGHGIVVEDEWYFLPHEATYERSSAAIAKKGLSATSIQQALVQAKAQRVMLMIDSCYSGAGVLQFERLQHFQRRFFRSLSRGAGVTVLAASRDDQEASEMDSLGHGLFSYVVLEGLNGKADMRPRDGQVTVHELIGYSAQTIPGLSRRYLGKNQEPMAFALGSNFTLRSR